MDCGVEKPERKQEVDASGVMGKENEMRLEKQAGGHTTKGLAGLVKF